MAGSSAGSQIFRCRKNFNLEAGKFVFHPGHMAKGMTKMQGHLRNVDCFLEVHDARIPFSGRNPAFFRKLTAIRPHVLVLNKMDLSDTSNMEEVKGFLMESEPHLADVIWTDSKIQYHQSIKAIVPLVHDAIERKAIHKPRSDINIMVLGVPNTGKSSVINALRRVNVRRGNVAPVADHAGVTRAVQERIKLSDDPPTFMLDTPGITEPNVADVETGMRLATCACYKDNLIGEITIADYILFFMNKRGMFQYVDSFGLDGPTDDIFVLLKIIAKSMKFSIKTRDLSSGAAVKMKYNLHAAALVFIKQFRIGTLGTMFMDDDKLLERKQKRVELIAG